MNSVVCLAWMLLLVSTGTLALRTCVDVQETMMACLMSSNINLTNPHGRHDIDRMCWEMRVMLDCVDEAQVTCPELPIFDDNSFSDAIRTMERQMVRHCDGTEGPMVNDQPADNSDNSCEPRTAMSHCAKIKVPEGDQEAKCRSWKDVLLCLEKVIDKCLDDFDQMYHFDVSQTIANIGDVIRTECPDEECDTVREEAERSCSAYLTDGNSPSYCRHLEMYVNCLHRSLTSCPDPELLIVVQNQFRHHCPPPAAKVCPEDLYTAISSCTSPLLDILPDNVRSYCQQTARYFECADDLIDRCKYDDRFGDQYFVGIEREREYVDRICTSESV